MSGTVEEQAQYFQDRYKAYFSKTSTSTKFATMLAAGDTFFAQQCAEQRATFLKHKQRNLDTLAPALQVQACFYSAMDNLLASPCRAAFITAARCLTESGNTSGTCLPERDAVLACAQANKLVAPTQESEQFVGPYSVKPVSTPYEQHLESQSRLWAHQLLKSSASGKPVYFVPAPAPGTNPDLSFATLLKASGGDEQAVAAIKNAIKNTPPSELPTFSQQESRDILDKYQEMMNEPFSPLNVASQQIAHRNVQSAYKRVLDTLESVKLP